MSETDLARMRHALALGARGLGQVWPNPAVGCVLFQGDRVVGRGWTQPGGRPHAEVVALAQAESAARGATAYVTLEPCAHHGQTPPCAEALVAAGVARVVMALEDPDPRVSGQGAALLRRHGVEVNEGIGAGAARASHIGFLRRVTLGLPAVTLKLALTLDGRIATVTGESRWITGPVARRKVHALRLCHDAVMVGAGTARADDPDLAVRDFDAVNQPLRIVIDTRLSLSPGSRLGRTADAVPVWICHGAAAPVGAISAWTATGARLIACPLDGSRIDIRAALRLLAQAGLTRVLCEGGGELAASLLRAGLVTELMAFTAGKVIGSDGIAAVGNLGVSELAQAQGFRLAEVRDIGGDVMSRWQQG